VIEDIKANRSIDPAKQFSAQIKSADKILYLMERGRIAQIQGDYVVSRDSFEAAIRAIKEDDDKAIISASGSAAQVTAVLVNDNAIPYSGDGYERVMLHHFQAMNYLVLNDIEGAGVEVRRANAEQEKALRRYQNEIQTTERTARKNKVSSVPPDEVEAAYADLDQFTGTVKSSFQNACTFYLSALVYEISGQLNDAYIDYKKALEIFSDNIYLQEDVLRLAQQLKMNDDLSRFKTLYPRLAANDLKKEAGGELVVLFEDDFVPRKEQVKIPIPVSLQKVVITAAAFPIYNITNMPVFPLVISEGGLAIASSEPVCFMSALAVKALKEKVAGIVVRQVIRSTLKAATAGEARKEFGALGSFLVSAYNLVTENADLRSWTTLPANVQVMRVALASGEHDIFFNHAGSGANVMIKANVQENSIMMIRVIRVGRQLRWVQLFPG